MTTWPRSSAKRVFCLVDEERVKSGEICPLLTAYEAVLNVHAPNSNRIDNIDLKFRIFRNHNVEFKNK